MITPGPYIYDEGTNSIVSTTVFEDWSVGIEDEDPVPKSVVCLYGAMGGEDSRADTRLLTASWEMHSILQDVLPIISQLSRPDGALLRRIEAILEQVN